MLSERMKAVNNNEKVIGTLLTFSLCRIFVQQFIKTTMNMEKA